jgi:hypothetical protein
MAVGIDLKAAGIARRLELLLNPAELADGFLDLLEPTGFVAELRSAVVELHAGLLAIRVEQVAFKAHALLQ